ncbi:unnamed protein product [Schistosoma rodhaini]|uniref:Alpha-galactosidase n=1 Tax=Schistosoma rodhaini TaxID=6188 RepID=A0AA85GFA3_9TREM|nr:unnamed protein product [Schistosoma rodhaini]
MDYFIVRDDLVIYIYIGVYSQLNSLCLPSRMCAILTIILQAIIFTASCVLCLNNGLTRTPPMGWKFCPQFRCPVNCQKYPKGCLSENEIKRTADKLVSDGWRDLGYKYMVIDDFWLANKRDLEMNNMSAYSTRFPNGIESVGKYLHSKNLLFGINLGKGDTKCSGYPEIINQLELDAKAVADWGVDFVKLHACHCTENYFEKYIKLREGTGRPVMLLCTYPEYKYWITNPNLFDWKRLQNTCNLWRASYNGRNDSRYIIHYIIPRKIHDNDSPNLAGSGRWNDPGLLDLGNNGLTNDQNRVHVGVWCMFAAPLLISTDMEKVDKFSASLLRNKHLLAINQDKGEHRAKFVKSRNDVQLWIRKLSDHPSGWVIAYVNTRDDGRSMKFVTSLDEFKSQMYTISGDKFHLLDVFTGERFKDVRLRENFTISINPSGIMMFRIIPFQLIRSSK